MLGEVLDLSAGLVVVLLPFILLSIPGIVLFVVLPAILLLALAVPLAVIGAVLAAPPLLLARWLRRRRRRAAPPPARPTSHASRAARTRGPAPIRDLGRA
jgi:pilus assembly protein TadC